MAVLFKPVKWHPFGCHSNTLFLTVCILCTRASLKSWQRTTLHACNTFLLILHAYTSSVQVTRYLSRSWVHTVNSPLLFLAIACIVVPWLVLREKSSSGVLNLELLPQEYRPRLTKCENDSVTLQPWKKFAYIVCSWTKYTHLFSGKLQIL